MKNNIPNNLINIRPIPSTSNKYGATIHGQIVNLSTKRILKPQKHRSGYKLISTTIDGVRMQNTVHRMVAEAWLGPCPEGQEVNHIGSKDDNTPSNLEYVTRKQNMQHAAANGLMFTKIDSTHKRFINNLLDEGLSVFKVTEIMNNFYDLGITRSVVEYQKKKNRQ